MENEFFQPKAFYRNLDSLLTRIGRGASTTEMMSLVLDELVGSFGKDLGIRGGCLYRFRGGSYRMFRARSGRDDGGRWPDDVPRGDEAVMLLHLHKSFIFTDTVVPPWGNNSVAVLVGESEQFMLVFRLGEDWVQETLEFVVNTIRSTLNFSRFATRIETDMQEAAEIQSSLLPEIDPEFEGYEIAGRSLPAERVGGDLYDFSTLAEGVLNFAIGDASGHGLPAALLARDVVTGLRMGMEKEMKISGMMRRLNRVINRSRLSTRFVSLFFGELEHGGTVVYVNAGHPRPILVKKDRVEKLDVGGTILGPLEDTVFQRGFAFMDPGDTLVLYTDGIVEAADPGGSFFGAGRLIDFVRERGQDSPAKIIGDLFREIKAFASSDKLPDDATAVLVRRLPPPG